MRKLQFFRNTIFRSFVAAAAGAALIAGWDFIPGIAATEQQLAAQPFVQAARSAQRVQNGDVLKSEMELYIWEDVYMMGEVFQIINVPGDDGDDYQFLIHTARHQHPSHDANTWLGGGITLLYWDVPTRLSVDEGDVVEFVATVVGFDTYTSVSDNLVTIPLLVVTEFREMNYPGTVDEEDDGGSSG